MSIVEARRRRTNWPATEARGTWPLVCQGSVLPSVLHMHGGLIARGGQRTYSLDLDYEGVENYVDDEMLSL